MAQAADASRLRDVMSRCGALGSERPRASFKTSNLEQDLTRLLKSGNVEQHRDVLERTLASSALAGEILIVHGVHMVTTWYALLQQKAMTYDSHDRVLDVCLCHALQVFSNAAPETYSGAIIIMRFVLEWLSFGRHACTHNLTLHVRKHSHFCPL